MAKYWHWHRKRSSKQLDNDHHGLMSSMVHFFDFHQQAHSSGRKHADGFEISKEELEVSTGVDMHELMDAGGDKFDAEDKMTKISTSSRQSSRGHVEAPIAEEMSKEQDQTPQIPDFLSQSMPLGSFYELELEKHALHGKSTRDRVCSAVDVHSHDTGVSAISTLDPLPHTVLDELRRQLLEKHAILQEKLDEAREAFLRQKSMDAKENTGDVTLQSKEFLDALEKFNANRELFLKILQDPNSVLADHMGSNKEEVTSKSGFFSRVVVSGRSHAKANKHKEKGTGSSEGKLQAGNSTMKLMMVSSSKDQHPTSMPVMGDDNLNGGLQLPARIVILKAGHGSPRTVGTDGSVLSSGELKNKSESRSGSNHFKGIKQRIKHVIKESRKERRRISMDGILHRIPHGHKVFKDAKIDMGDQWKETAMGQVGRESPRFSCGSASSRSWDSLNSFGRISLGESPVRHSRWPESALSREAKRDLDDQNLHGRKGTKSFGRIQSLPEFKSLELYSPDRDDQSEVGSEVIDTGKTGSLDDELDNSDEQNSVGTSIDTEHSMKLDVFIENVSTENLVETNRSNLIKGTPIELAALDAEEDGTGTVFNNLTVGANNYNPLHEHEISTPNYSITELVKPSSVSVLGSYFQEDIANPAKKSVSEDTVDCSPIVTGSELKLRHLHFDEMDPIINPKDQFNTDTPSEMMISKTDILMVPIPTQHAVSDSMHIQVNARDEADFTYVRDVLKASGFSNDEFLGRWHLPDQPMNPSLFDGAEGSPVNHLLLFDCINEVLLEIYEKSFSDCPWILSFNSHIWPMPVGYHVLEEVWAGISWHLTSQSQPNPSLEYLVARDLAKSESWMDLRSDIECVGLELEALILDDLLEEALIHILT